jgi:integrase
MTLGQLCEWWLRERCPSSSAYRERSRLRRHVMDAALGAVPLTAVTAARIEERQREMERAGLARSYLNGLRRVLHTVFARARRDGLWSGPNPIDEVEKRPEPKRAYVTLRAEEVPLLLAAVPDGWRAVFAAALYTGLRKGELFGLRRNDVDLDHRTITVRRSYDRETTKGGHADAIPIAEALVPFLEQALASSTSELVFPGPDGHMRSQEADPQKILRTALARAGLVDYWVHSCRRCKRSGEPHTERHADGELRPCPRCGMKLWPTAKVRPMRFHDLRHSTATLLLREHVDAHRVQRLLRHRDMKTTTGTYGHLVVEDLREAINLLPPAPFAASLLQDPRSTPPGVQNSTIESSENQQFGLERETGVEPATLSLGS